MKKNTRHKVMMVAPVHRAWGNRVIRESKILVDAGYEVVALLKSDQGQQSYNMHIISTGSFNYRSLRFLQFIKNFIICYSVKADIYHLHNPDTIPIAFLLKLFGRKVIYDTHEDYSRRLLMRNWIPKLLRKPMCRFVTIMEKLTSYGANAMFVTQRHQLNNFSEKTHLLRNAPDIDDKVRETVQALTARIESDAEIFKIVYIGGLSKERGLFTMLDALIECNRTSNIRLWLAGGDMTNVLDKAKLHPGWKYVDYLGVVSQEQAFAYFSKADVGLAVLSDTGDHSSALPSKLFEYMGFGLPFIATDFKIWKDFISPYEPGFWLKADDPLLLAECINTAKENDHILKRMSNQGELFIENFNWGNESQILLKAYRNLLS